MLEKKFKFINSSVTEYGIAKHLERQMCSDGWQVSDDGISLCYANDIGSVEPVNKNKINLENSKTLKRAIDSNADYIFYSQKSCEEFFKGDNCFLLPSAIDDKIFYDKSLYRNIDIGFCGYDKFDSRKKFLSFMKNTYGKKFVWKTDIFYEDLADFYNQCKIVVNDSVSDEITMRMFEATACGALLITREVPYLSELFIIGKEVVVYKNEIDLKNKINYYLNNKKKARQIALSGQIRTLKEHKYSNRVKEIYTAIDKSVPSICGKHRNVSWDIDTKKIDYRNVGAGNLKKNKKIADIIIPHHNRHDHLFNCLNNLDNDIFNIIIVSGGSFAENCNKGARLAETDNLIFLNDDVIPDINLFKESCNMKADMVGFYQYVPDEKKFKSGIKYKLVDGEVKGYLVDSYNKPDIPTGFCFRIKKKVWEKIGGFDEDFVNGCEDHDLGFKILDNGFSIDYIKNALIHRHSQSKGRFENVLKNNELLKKKWSDSKIIKLLNLKNKKRALVMTNHLKRLGGSETFTYTLAEEINNRNEFDVDVFTFKKGVVSDRISEFANIVDDLKDIYDIIFINHNTCLEKVKDFKGFKIFTSHGIYPELEQPKKGADVYVSISEEVKNHLKEKGYNSEVIYNGIDCNRYKPKKDIGKKIKNVFSLCQDIEANKIIDSACKELGIKFKYIGQGSEDIKKARQWNIVDEINNADLVFSLGRGAYEAMACGRSVFVFDTRRYSKINGGDGIITKDNIEEIQKNNMSGRAFRIPFNKDGIIEEFKKYSKNQGMFNRNYALNNLNIIKQVDKYLDLYNKHKK